MFICTSNSWPYQFKSVHNSVIVRHIFLIALCVFNYSIYIISLDQCNTKHCNIKQYWSSWMKFVCILSQCLNNSTQSYTMYIWILCFLPSTSKRFLSCTSETILSKSPRRGDASYHTLSLNAKRRAFSKVCFNFSSRDYDIHKYQEITMFHDF